MQLHRRVARVGNVHLPPVEDGGAGDVFARQRHRIARLQRFGLSAASATGDGAEVDGVAFGQRDDDGRVREQPQPAAHDGIERRLRVGRRIADDFENFRGRGLLLQRLGEIVGALAQLVEQPRVLDGDDGLRGEVLHQLDLLVGEGLNLLAVDGDHADQFVILEHRHRKHGADAADLNAGDRKLIAAAIGFVGPQVGDLDRLARSRDARQSARPVPAGTDVPLRH